MGGFPGGSDGKESARNAGDLGLIPGLGRSPGGGHGNPPQYSCLENPHGQKCLVGYSPWGHKESDTTERLSIQVGIGVLICRWGPPLDHQWGHSLSSRQQWDNVGELLRLPGDRRTQHHREGGEGIHVCESEGEPKTRALGRAPKTFITPPSVTATDAQSRFLLLFLPSPLSQSLLWKSLSFPVMLALTPPHPISVNLSMHLSPPLLPLSNTKPGHPSAPGPSLSHCVAYHHLHSSHSCSKLGPLFIPSNPQHLYLASCPAWRVWQAFLTSCWTSPPNSLPSRTDGTQAEAWRLLPFLSVGRTTFHFWSIPGCILPRAPLACCPS